MEYAIDLPAMQWNKQAITELMLAQPGAKWINEQHGTMPHIKYINKYLRVGSHPLFEEIYQQYPELELKPEYTFFMELSPGVLLAPHRDVGRAATINFPLLGDWAATPIRFHKQGIMSKADIVYEHVYSDEHPTLINTSELHSVKNPTSGTRYMLSMSVHKPWEDIKRILRA